MNYVELTQAERDSEKMVWTVINKYHFVKDRVSELEKLGYGVGYKCMGSGGVGQYQRYHKKVIMQIGYGVTEYNYAHYVYLVNN